MAKQHYNGIVVTLENFYKYSYLYTLKNLFNPKDAWLYGNLSPLVNIEDLEQNKELYVSYALKTNPVLKEIKKPIYKEILDFYKTNRGNTNDIDTIEMKIKEQFNKFVK